MPVYVPKIGCLEDIGDLRVQRAGLPAENLSSRFKTNPWALGYAKRLTIAGPQINIFGEAQSRSVPTYYLYCWTVCGQIREMARGTSRRSAAVGDRPGAEPGVV